MALTSGTLAKKPRSFDPLEPEWHRMISEAAYFLAEKRGFVAIGILCTWSSLAPQQSVPCS